MAAMFVAISLFAYLIVATIVQRIVDLTTEKPVMYVVEEQTLEEHFRQGVVKTFGIVWFFALGATTGSFLNVVAYRMPKGRSITGSSHCPYCTVKIRSVDNIPVLGWLMLGGRCRTCRLPISPRYPIVEFVMATIFGVLLFVELLSGGENLPLGARYPFYSGFLWIIFYTKWNMVGLYLYHMLLFWTLLGCALIKLDGNRIPLKLTLFTGSLGLAMPLIFTEMAWNIHTSGRLDDYSFLDRLTTSGLGVGVGIALGMAIGAILSWLQTNSVPPSRQRPAAIVTLGLVGLFLGWKAVLSVAAMALVFDLLIRVVGVLWDTCSAIPFSFPVLAAAFLQVCIWKFLTRLDWWPGSSAAAQPIALSIAAILITALLCGLLTRVTKHAARSRESVKLV